LERAGKQRNTKTPEVVTGGRKSLALPRYALLGKPNPFMKTGNEVVGGWMTSDSIQRERSKAVEGDIRKF